MNSESRIVRPYVGIDRLQRCLDEVGLDVGGEEIEVGGERILTAEKYLSLPVSIVLADDDTELSSLRYELAGGTEELGLDASDVELAVVAYSARLKRTDLVWRLRVTELEDLPARIEVASAAERPAGLRAPFGGCRVELYLCLSKQLEQEALRPWRLGTWIARARFKLRTDLGEFGFTPRALTDELRKEFKLPEGTNRYVRVDGATVPGVGEESVELYVDEELLGQLSEFKSTFGAIALQRQLFLDALSAIAFESLREPDFQDKSIDELEDSLCGRVVRLVAAAGLKDTATVRRDKEEGALNMLRDDPARFLAHLEAECDTKPSWESAIKGEQE